MPGRCVAKTVVIRTGETFVLAVLPATSRVDLDRFASAVRMDRALVRLATAGEIDAIFHDCEPGTIPPFGRLYGLRTVVDASLQELGMAVFRTNARHQGLRMAFRDFEGLEEPMPAQFSEPITRAQSGHFEAHTGTQDEGGLSLGARGSLRCSRSSCANLPSTASVDGPNSWSSCHGHPHPEEGT